MANEDENGNGGNGHQRVELELWGIKLKLPSKRTSEIIAVLSLVVSVMVGAGGWLFYMQSTHADEITAKNQEKIIKSVDAVKETAEKQSRYLKEMVRFNFIQTCLQQYPEDQKRAHLGDCKELARQSGMETN